MVQDLRPEGAGIGLAAADAFAQFGVAVPDGLSQDRAGAGGVRRAQEGVQAGPLGGEGLLLALQLPADDADNVGRDAGVEAAGASDDDWDGVAGKPATVQGDGADGLVVIRW